MRWVVVAALSVGLCLLFFHVRWAGELPSRALKSPCGAGSPEQLPEQCFPLQGRHRSLPKRMGVTARASIPAESPFPPPPQARGFSGGSFFSHTFITLIHKD